MKRRTAITIGRAGGRSKSAVKAEAARTNGSLGGRPRTDAPRCPCGAMTVTCAQARAHLCLAIR